MNVDRSVLAAYGWPEGIGDEDILKNLLALNLEKERAKVRSRLVRPQIGVPDTPVFLDRDERVGRIVAPALRPAHNWL